ncbi:hypothetical protein ACHQM5_009060 [Ranunculus cassubicifolius]
MGEHNFPSWEDDENEVTIQHDPLPEEIGFQEGDDCQSKEDEACEPNDSMVEDNVTPCPCVGLEFNSHEEAYDFYNRYARYEEAYIHLHHFVGNH